MLAGHPRCPSLAIVGQRIDLVGVGAMQRKGGGAGEWDETPCERRGHIGFHQAVAMGSGQPELLVTYSTTRRVRSRRRATGTDRRPSARPNQLEVPNEGSWLYSGSGSPAILLPWLTGPFGKSR